MKLIFSFVVYLAVVTGCSFGQTTEILTNSILSNNSYLPDSSFNLTALKSIQPIKYYLVNSGGTQNPVSLQYYQQLALTKFYFESEKPTTVKDEKEEKSQSKWDWLYFAGTAVAAVIVYFAWPDKSPQSKQTLTFGKPLPPR